jgi:hypothetical protein
MDNNTTSKASPQVPLRLSVHTEWRNSSKKVILSIISQFHAIQVVETPSPTVHPTSSFSSPNTNLFFDNPQGIPPSHGTHDHSIPLVPGSLPPNVHPYHHPFSQKNEIEKIVQELLAVGVIHPSTNPYSSLCHHGTQERRYMAHVP